MDRLVIGFAVTFTLRLQTENAIPVIWHFFSYSWKQYLHASICPFIEPLPYSWDEPKHLGECQKYEVAIY